MFVVRMSAAALAAVLLTAAAAGAAPSRTPRSTINPQPGNVPPGVMQFRRNNLDVDAIGLATRAERERKHGRGAISAYSLVSHAFARRDDLVREGFHNVRYDGLEYVIVRGVAQTGETWLYAFAYDRDSHLLRMARHHRVAAASSGARSPGSINRKKRIITPSNCYD